LFHVFSIILMTQNYSTPQAHTARYGPGGGTCKIFVKSVILPETKRRTLVMEKKVKNVFLSR
ncbi:MAG TPA: hypothetical protein VI112_01875, partial [Bacteroidia bacterium]